MRLPWQHRWWIFPRAPYFALKAGRVLDLYQRIWDGQPLTKDEYLLSADEKPGVQARRRIHPALLPRPRRAMRAESEYARGGTLACLAAYDVHRARRDRPVRAHHRNQAVHRLGGPGDEHRTVCLGTTGVLGRG